MIWSDAFPFGTNIWAVFNYVSDSAASGWTNSTTIQLSSPCPSASAVNGKRVSDIQAAYRHGHRFGNAMLTTLVSTILGEALLACYRVTGFSLATSSRVSSRSRPDSRSKRTDRPRLGTADADSRIRHPVSGASRGLGQHLVPRLPTAILERLMVVVVHLGTLMPVRGAVHRRLSLRSKLCAAQAFLADGLSVERTLNRASPIGKCR